ncbi:MAG: copper resistance protein NlpE [Cyclobacteriaceae bacterium]|nr:copper resistance protein NlpE N-terminal domain-containing protein [Cyclobacteriaceae bacterium]MCH8517206.1 copper resistance protein NlpE [Cyclobacteriaceae bacterium]
MKESYYILLLFGILFFLFGCHNSQPSGLDETEREKTFITDRSDEDKTYSSPADNHNSRIALDWDGVYQGVLPCADCEGIEMRIELMQNGQYQMIWAYLPSDKKMTDQGEFEWDDKGRSVMLSSSKDLQFQVGENRLFKLDRNGRRIEGEISDRYILEKQN